MNVLDVWTGLRLAVGTLTIVPMGSLPTVTRAMARWAMLLAPVAALPLGLLGGAVAFLGATVHLPPLVTAALVCVALGWGTRAMHWDGLADTADGLAAGWDRERALSVMRRGDAGPVAVGTLVLVLVLEVAGLAAVVSRPWGWLLVGTVVVAARAACSVTSSRRVPAAREDGLGAMVAGSVPTVGTVASGVLVAALLVAGGRPLGVPWWLGVIAAVVGLGAVTLLVRRCRRVLGGVTGDVMGAGIEVALCAMVVVLSQGVAG